MKIPVFFLSLSLATQSLIASSAFPGERGVNLCTATREDIWEREPQGFMDNFVRVERDEVIGFALYTQQAGVLKMTAQLFPLKPGEDREVTLELDRGDGWEKTATATVQYPGWFAHLRVEDWDGTKNVPYRVRHSGGSTFEGLIRQDPVHKQEIVIASLSCNSRHDRGGPGFHRE